MFGAVRSVSLAAVSCSPGLNPAPRIVARPLRGLRLLVAHRCRCGRCLQLGIHLSMNIKPALAALAILLTTGCTEAQRYALQVGQSAQTSLVSYKACQRIIEASPEFIGVYQKLAVSTGDDPFREPTAAQLSDREVISAGDKSVFLDWFSKSETCSTPTMEDLGRLAPEIEVYFADAQADQADILNEFIANRHTYGEANAAISALKARIKARAKEMGANIQARFTAWGQEEAEQTAENVGFLIGYPSVPMKVRHRPPGNLHSKARKCAWHGHWIGGESPLRGELVATASRRQLHAGICRRETPALAP